MSALSSPGMGSVVMPPPSSERLPINAAGELRASGRELLARPPDPPRRSPGMHLLRKLLQRRSGRNARDARSHATEAPFYSKGGCPAVRPVVAFVTLR